MSSPPRDMTPQQVRVYLGKLSYELGELLSDYSAANLAKARAEQAYKRAFAAAFLKAVGPQEERKQNATLATADLSAAAAEADVVFDNLRAALRVLGQRLDAGRTIASTIRAEGIASGVGT